jgi:hypothetical protein
MSVEIDPNMPGLDEASRRLDEMMAEESAAVGTTAADNQTNGSATDEQRAAQGTTNNAPKQTDSSPSDTLATADKPVATDKSQDKQETKPATETKETKAEAERSRYAKSQDRLAKTWDSVNAEKARIESERVKIEAERADFAKKQAEFEAIRKQAEQPQYTPDDYKNAAQQKRALADHQRAEADRLENAGKFDDAEKLRKTALKNDALSEDLAEHAENLRRNPPQGFQQKAAQYEQQKQAWTVEAAKAFPDLAKDGSPFQKTVANHLQALAKQDPSLLANPSVIYHVARLTAAEAAAARVPVMEKELEQLKAKVKEYETLTAPGSSPIVPRLGQTSQNDEEADLERMAREMVTLR